MKTRLKTTAVGLTLLASSLGGCMSVQFPYERSLYLRNTPETPLIEPVFYEITKHSMPPKSNPQASSRYSVTDIAKK